jgi:hypothetical protein
MPAEDESTLLGFPAELADGDDPAIQPVDDTESDGALSSRGLVVIKRADPVGAAALVLAGVAANVSLLLSWTPSLGPTGLTLVRRGVEALGSRAPGAFGGVSQPVVVIVCGGLLVLLGCLLLVPARAHRFIGVLALIVALVAAVAVIFLMADTDLIDDRLGPGMWCALAVPVLGVLGAVKAMLTAPLVTLSRP